MKISRNLKAFLDTIAVSELGVDLLHVSDDGYDVVVGSTAAKPILMKFYRDHPRKRITLTIKGKVVKSTAAGRYQVLVRYFDHYQRSLGLPDFGPESQDAIAIQLIRECGALDEIERGEISKALSLCRSRWASLPGAGYGQHENTEKHLLTAYTRAGGSLA